MSTKTEAGPVARHWNIPGSQHPERLFAEWLNEHRMADVSSVFHEIVRRYAEALAAHPPAQEQPAPAVPLSDQRIHDLWRECSAEVARMEAERRYEFASWLKVAVRLTEKAHGIGATHPTPADRAEQPQAEQELRELLARSVAGAALCADDGELQDNSELPAIDFKRDAPGEIARKLTDRGLKRLTKADRVHALVNDGPWPGMSEAFDAHMGAACWTDPAYRQDAATWAAAWKASKRAEQPPRDAVQQGLTDAQVKRLYENLKPSQQQDARSFAAFRRLVAVVESAHGIATLKGQP